MIQLLYRLSNIIIAKPIGRCSYESWFVANDAFVNYINTFSTFSRYLLLHEFFVNCDNKNDKDACV